MFSPLLLVDLRDLRGDGKVYRERLVRSMMDGIIDVAAIGWGPDLDKHSVHILDHARSSRSAQCGRCRATPPH